jgi:hypothetical protein
MLCALRVGALPNSVFARVPVFARARRVVQPRGGETIATIQKAMIIYEEGRTARRPRDLTDERG